MDDLGFLHKASPQIVCPDVASEGRASADASRVSVVKGSSNMLYGLILQPSDDLHSVSRLLRVWRLTTEKQRK